MILILLGIVLASLLGTSDAQGVPVFDESKYVRNATLHEEFDISWTIDEAKGTIMLAIHAKAATGWAGFGIAEVGGMAGSDIVYYEAASGSLVDSFAVGNSLPITDDCEGHWNLTSAQQIGEGMVIEAERLLDTGDPHDWPFLDDTLENALPTRVIAAWGDEEVISYHTTDRRVAASVTFFGDTAPAADPLAAIKAEEGMGFFDVGPVDFPVPTNKTYYLDTCVGVGNWTAEGFPAAGPVHVVGFEAVISPDTIDHIHHLVLTGFASESCKYTESFELGLAFLDMFVWTKGSRMGEALPDEAGFRFSADNPLNFKAFKLSTHYDNPEGEAGLTDSTAVRFYYTENLREHDAGALVLGDPVLTLMDEPLVQGRSKYSFDCPSSCTEESFQDDSVTIFAELLHMHELGRRMEVQQFRGGELVRAADVEYYDFNYQGAYPTRVVGATIEKGDSFEVECFYETPGALETSTVASTFGLGSENEMCIAYVFYYPAQPASDLGGYCGAGDFCGGSFVGSEPLTADSDFGRAFGVDSDGVCEQSLSEAGEGEGESSPAASAWPRGLGAQTVGFTAAASIALGAAMIG